MAEAFPQPDPSEHRTGNVIRRRGGGHHHEKAEHDYVFDYISQYGDPNSYEQSFGGRTFEQLLGAPDSKAVNEIAKEEGLIHCKLSKGGETLCFIKQDGKYFHLDEKALARYFELVKEHQGENDPQNPGARFPHDLREVILGKLKQGGEEVPVLYYASAGTALDHTHDIGADAFFEIDGDIIALDLTLRTDKDEGENLGADILISGKDISMIHELNPAIEGKQKELAQQAYTQQLNTLADRFIAIHQARKQKAA